MDKQLVAWQIAHLDKHHLVASHFLLIYHIYFPYIIFFSVHYLHIFSKFISYHIHVPGIMKQKHNENENSINCFSWELTLLLPQEQFHNFHLITPHIIMMELSHRACQGTSVCNELQWLPCARPQCWVSKSWFCNHYFSLNLLIYTPYHSNEYVIATQSQSLLGNICLQWAAMVSLSTLTVLN